ncbi:hypothetical protein GGR51DRAFT_315064 [Nemania sp. FL0031]|nr:hypothetical protein GGR51DRAFT_315064 [Nemania sp. FL0031]
MILAPPPTQPPRCCDQVGTRFITRSSNPNGNAGRPYYKCLYCGKFLVFDDWRGNTATNPECHCGHSSKRQVTGRYKRAAGQWHFVCRLGACNFYSLCKDEKGEDIFMDMDLTEAFSRLFLI